MFAVAGPMVTDAGREAPTVWKYVLSLATCATAAFGPPSAGLWADLPSPVAHQSPEFRHESVLRSLRAPTKRLFRVACICDPPRCEKPFYRRPFTTNSKHVFGQFRAPGVSLTALSLRGPPS